MKLCNRIAAVLLLVFLLPVTAGAEGIIDPGKEVSLTVFHSWEDQPLPDTPIPVYRIAQVAQTGELLPLEAYGEFTALLDIRGENAHAWEAAALRLEQYVLDSDIAPTATEITDSSGGARFWALEQGLYLVPGTEISGDSCRYTTSPFLIQLPGRGQGEWEYHVSARTKAEREENTTTLTIQKLWADRCHRQQRPERIEVALYRDGRWCDVIELSQEKDWQVTLEGLPGDSHWEIRENIVGGYRSEIFRSGDQFLIRNTCTRPRDTEAPNTGQDLRPMQVMAASGTALLCILFYQLRRRKKRG